MESISLLWQSAYSEPAKILLGTTFIYVLYHYFLSADFWQARWEKKYASEVANQRSCLLQNFGGGVFLGGSALGLAFFLAPVSHHYGFTLNQWQFSLGSGLGLFFILAPILYFAAKNPKQYALYPTIRSLTWTPQSFSLYAFSWVIYLLGYEFFFRGFLLFALTSLYGAWPAIFITTALYVVVHLPKSAGETIGCIPIGLWWAWSALYSGSILGPFIAHALIACSTQFFCIQHHPEMRWSKQRN